MESIVRDVAVDVEDSGLTRGAERSVKRDATVNSRCVISCFCFLAFGGSVEVDNFDEDAILAVVWLTERGVALLPYPELGWLMGSADAGGDESSDVLARRWAIGSSLIGKTIRDMSRSERELRKGERNRAHSEGSYDGGSAGLFKLDGMRTEGLSIISGRSWTKLNPESRGFMTKYLNDWR